LNPVVSFVVPCYRLAHLLSECVNSILAQTYENFEVLIMDDCSPDDTPQVARSFTDPRIRYIRNEPNLGHLRNYNKGIELSRGKYVWLISADDRLRRPHVLERYVKILENHPRVGYVFCPGVALFENKEVRVVNAHGSSDWIKNGRTFLKQLLHSNSVVAASGMARRQCYEKVAYFPLDMPWGGDWYLWCAYALHYDVAYVAEPLVNYRTHELSLTTFYTTKEPSVCTKDDMLLYWRIKWLAENARERAVATRCRHMIGYHLARNVFAGSPKSPVPRTTLSESEDCIRQMASDDRDAALILARLHACLGDKHFWNGEFATALLCYRKALDCDPLLIGIWAKRLLLPFGGIGLRSRRIIDDFRHRKQRDPLFGQRAIGPEE